MLTLWAAVNRLAKACGYVPPPPIVPTKAYAGVRSVEQAQRYLKRVPGAVAGSNGHNATFRVACLLVGRFGLVADQALELLTDWNRTCQPPWEEWELRHKVADAIKQTSGGRA
jgi:hypothetical protein